MQPLKRKVSCTFKRETPLEVQERICPLRCHSERSEESRQFPKQMPRPFVALRVTTSPLRTHRKMRDVCATREAPP